MAIFENVLGLKGQNLVTVKHMCGLVGYVIFDYELNTNDYYLPQRRPRIWLLAYSKTALQSAGASAGEAHSFLANIMNTLGENNPCLSLDEVLLPETSPNVIEYLDECSSLQGPYGMGLGTQKVGWLEAYFSAGGLDAWLDRSARLFDMEDAELFPGVNVLTLRQCDTIQLKGVDKLPFSPAHIINVNHSLSWAGLSEGRSCAVVPNAQLSHTERCRSSWHQTKFIANKSIHSVYKFC